MILVLTTPRTASSWFCDYIAWQHNYTQSGELFNLPALKGDLAKQAALLDSITADPNQVVKVFPWHIRRVLNLPTLKVLSNLDHKLISAAEKLYFLARKDFNAQCRSYYISTVTDHWDGDKLDTRFIKYDPVRYKMCADTLKLGYQCLAGYYSLAKEPIMVYTENLPQTGKYEQPVVWDTEPDLIDFDVTACFK